MRILAYVDFPLEPFRQLRTSVVCMCTFSIFIAIFFRHSRSCSDKSTKVLALL